MKIEELNLNPNLLKALNDLGFTEFTQIQEKCIPVILEGKDIFGHSSTGSGKTAAFGLPIFEKLECGKGIQALVLTPTRELCVQVTEALRSFAKFLHTKVASVYGGVGIEPQIEAVKKADIVVGTPGRILDHINRKTIHLNNVKFFVLDEADKMFEMGFIDDVEDIMKYIPSKKQTLLFSATLPPTVMHIINRHLRSPVTIKGHVHVDKCLLKQVYYDLKTPEKFSLLVHLIKKNLKGLAIVFCGTRREVDVLSRNLSMQDIRAVPIHGGLTQNRRLKALEVLKGNDNAVLVATDVAARGLDIKNVSHVYNYDVPKSSEDYIHRIGRTARAGMQGDAVTLLTERDHENFRRVLSDRSIQIQKVVPPHFEMVKFQRFHEKRERGDGNFRVSRDHSKNTGFRGDSRDKSFGEEKKHFGNRSGSSRRRWNN
ncbi:DEAD/DEAH box helicase [Candidatus Woesearchaeota archaeon]|nr:DEAD/DEAH box helicase [Candidatus Woesearchaeota archaeon]